MHNQTTTSSRNTACTPIPGSLPKDKKRKSRAGCRNCKLRKLKCDETRPQCRRCTVYGVLCNIKFNIPDLQPVGERRASRHRVDFCSSPRPPISNGLWTAGGATSSSVDERSREILDIYRTCSTYSKSDYATGWQVVKDGILKLAFIHPFLMHAVLAFGSVHRRYLSSPSSTQPHGILETHHLSQCTTLFNARLSLPVPPQDRDAVWATAATLAVIAFSSLDTNTPRNAWPLKPPDPSSGLEWLRISDGKNALWPITDPLRPDSIFAVMAPTIADMYAPVPRIGIDGVDPLLAEICGLNGDSTAEGSPYFTAAHAVCRLYGLGDEMVTNGTAFLFSSQMQPGFKGLLERKDPVALLMLYLWYRRARIAVWWVDIRVRLECPAIRMYLRRYHREDRRIMAILDNDRWGSRRGAVS